MITELAYREFQKQNFPRESKQADSLYQLRKTFIAQVSWTYVSFNWMSLIAVIFNWEKKSLFFFKPRLHALLNLKKKPTINIEVYTELYTEGCASTNLFTYYKNVWRVTKGKVPKGTIRCGCRGDGCCLFLPRKSYSFGILLSWSLWQNPG